ncbi:protein kinase [bacterium]|nr:protein kinase [bacterium]
MRLLQDRYQVVRELGRGGDGAVYLCRDLRLAGSMWAIKELPSGGAERQAFEREASILSQLDHPRIPVVVDFFVQDDHGYLVREFLDGPSLYDWIESSGPVSEAQAVHWGVQIAEVLAYLHQRQPPLYHRDLKPQNLMVVRDGIRLIDFGLAREDRGQIHVEQAGSMSFTAPEQIGAAHRLGPEADLYSLGAILYYLLMGVPPGPTGGEHRLLHQRPNLSPNTEQLVLQCLEPDLKNRLKDVGQVLSALQYQAARLPVPPPIQAPQRKEQPKEAVEKPRTTTRWMVLASLVPLMGLLAVATGLALSQPEARPAPTVSAIPASSTLVPWPKIQEYIAARRWDEAEGALRVTLSSKPGSGWARLALTQLPLLRGKPARVPLLLPLGGQEEEHVNWILQGVALGQQQESRFVFDLIDTHATPPLDAWQKLQGQAKLGMVLGPFGSQDALMLAPLAGKTPLLPLGSTDPRVAQSGASVFPLGFPHWARVAALIGHAVKESGPGGLIFYSKDSKAMSTSAKFAVTSLQKETGKEPVKLGFHPDDNPQEVAAQVAAQRADWIYLSDNLHGRAAQWIARLREGGVSVPVICVFHPASEEFVRELKDVPGQVWLVEPLWQERDADFVQRWTKVFYGTEVDWNSALGYDAARLASRHWKAQGAAAVLADIQKSRPYQGLLGEYDLAHNGFKPYPFRYRVVVIENGARQAGAEL